MKEQKNPLKVATAGGWRIQEGLAVNDSLSAVARGTEIPRGLLRE